MKILCLCYEDMGGYAGSNIQIIELARNLDELGHNVEICAPLIRRSKEAEPVKINYIPVINLPILQYISYLIASPLYLIKQFLKFKPDVLLIFEIYLDLGTLLACKMFNCPFVLYINGIVSEEFRLAKVPRYIIWLIEYIQKLYIRLSVKIFAVTDVLKKDIHKRYNVGLDKIEIIKNAVDTENFKPMDKHWARNQLGFHKELNIIGFVGSLYEWQGVDYLIESAPLILKEIPNCRFVIVGQGRMMRELVGKTKSLGLEEVVIFTGVKPFEQVPLYINAFDVCVAFFKPVRTDPGEPIKLYEYLACAKPAVASNVKGYGDFVESIGAGVSVEASNPQAVAEAITRLIKDEPLRKEMGKKGRSAIEKEHTWEKRAREIEHFLYKIDNG